MRLIVGLGNPDNKYSETRHNIGRNIVLEFVKQKELSKSTKYNVDIYKWNKIMFIDLNSFMNVSGIPLARICSYFKILPSEILVVHDEMDLPFGQMRFRTKGSSAGHNGIKSIIAELKTKDFNRLRIGISRPPQYMEVNNYVLGKFSSEEKEQLADITKKAFEYFENKFE